MTSQEHEYLCKLIRLGIQNTPPEFKMIVDRFEKLNPILPSFWDDVIRLYNNHDLNLRYGRLTDAQILQGRMVRLLLSRSPVQVIFDGIIRRLNTYIKVVNSLPAPALYTAQKVIDGITKNIFGPIGVFRRNWFTPQCRAFALQLKETKEWGSLPIFADWMEESDCVDNTILSYLRDVEKIHYLLGKHCWIIDLILH